jgi:hypothetical protein
LILEGKDGRKRCHIIISLREIEEKLKVRVYTSGEGQWRELHGWDIDRELN